VPAWKIFARPAIALICKELCSFHKRLKAIHFKPSFSQKMYVEKKILVNPLVCPCKMLANFTFPGVKNALSRTGQDSSGNWKGQTD